jgi:DHA1 family multidrug resistance protein-like MFS transporter
MSKTINVESPSPSSSLKEKEKETDHEEAGNDLEARERSNNVDAKLETEEADPYLVEWQGDDDPENPLNFKTRRKVILMVMIAAIAFLTY